MFKTSLIMNSSVLLLDVPLVYQKIWQQIPKWQHDKHDKPVAENLSKTYIHLCYEQSDNRNILRNKENSTHLKQLLICGPIPGFFTHSPFHYIISYVT